MSENYVAGLKLIALLILDASVAQGCMPKQNRIDAATTSSGLSCAIAYAVRRSEQVAGNEHVLTESVSHATNFVALRRGTEFGEFRVRDGVRID